MTAFSEPTKWAQALGATANADVIPDEAGATEVDISKIFPAAFSVPLSRGGKAIPRRALNGLFKTLGEWSFYAQNGGIASYDEAIDYVVGRVVLHDGNIYLCTQSSNSENPHSPVDANFWSKITTIADVASDFAKTDLSNLNAAGQAIIEGKADRSLSNVDSTANILMAHNAMPSNVYDNLTLGASGSTYTAPADGYFAISKTAGGSGFSYVQLSNGVFTTSVREERGDSSADLFVWIPIKKGAVCPVLYNATGNLNYFRFIYAVGSESEQGA